jgi:hypothetical protein
MLQPRGVHQFSHAGQRLLHTWCGEEEDTLMLQPQGMHQTSPIDRSLLHAWCEEAHLQPWQLQQMGHDGQSLHLAWRQETHLQPRGAWEFASHMVRRLNVAATRGAQMESLGAEFIIGIAQRRYDATTKGCQWSRLG